MKFLVSNPFVKTLKTDKSARIEFDLDDPNEVSEAFKLMQEASGNYIITVESVDIDNFNQYQNERNIN